MGNRWRSRIDDFKRQPIGPQAVVVDVGQRMAGSSLISKPHAPLAQQSDLVIGGQRRLGEFHNGKPKKRNPPGCASLRGVAGVVG